MSDTCKKGIGTRLSAQYNGDIHERKFYDRQARKWEPKLCIIVDALSFRIHFIVVYAWIILTILWGELNVAFYQEKIEKSSFENQKYKFV